MQPCVRPHVASDRFQLPSFTEMLAQLCQFESQFELHKRTHAPTHAQRAYVIMLAYREHALFAHTHTHTHTHQEFSVEISFLQRDDLSIISLFPWKLCFLQQSYLSGVLT